MASLFETLAGFVKQIIILVNTVFFALGGVLLVLGILMALLAPTIVSTLFSILPLIPGSINLTALPGGVSFNLTSINTTVQIFGYVFVGLGSPVVAVALVGCCGLCCNKKLMLYLYCVASFLLCVVVMAVLFIWLYKAVDSLIFSAMELDLEANYQGPLATNPESLLMNIIMAEFHCCGLLNYTEFANATQWNSTYFYTAPNNQIYNFTQMVPATCCILNGTFPTALPIDLNCPIAPTANNSYINTSCKSAVTLLLDSQKAIVVTVLFAVAAFEAVCFVLSLYLSCKKNTDKKKQSSKAADDNNAPHNATTPGPTPAPNANSTAPSAPVAPPNAYQSYPFNPYYARNRVESLPNMAWNRDPRIHPAAHNPYNMRNYGARAAPRFSPNTPVRTQLPSSAANQRGNFTGLPYRDQYGNVTANPYGNVSGGRYAAISDVPMQRYPPGVQYPPGYGQLRQWFY